MQKLEKKELLSVIIVLAVVLIGEILFFYKQGNPLVDTGREFYIPQKVLEGGVLYKDIFNIYGPLAYQFNALLYEIFGLHTNVLYFAGNLTGLVLVLGIYLLSRQLTGRWVSVAVACFAALVGIYRAVIFNYVVPYSFAMLYGSVMLIFSLLFLVIYVKDKSKIAKLFLSLLFAGAAVVLKYDFLTYLIVYLFAIDIPKLDKKTLLGGILSFIAIPTVSIGALFVSGLNVSDIVMNVGLFKNIASADSLTYFYKFIGVYPTWEELGPEIAGLGVFSVVFAALYWLFCKISRFVFFIPVVAFVALAFAGISVHFELAYKFNFLALLVFLLCLIVNKKLFENKPLCVFVCASLLVSLKTFFSSGIQFYGLFTLPLLFLAFCVLLENYFVKNEKALKALIFIIIISVSASSLVHEFSKFNYYTQNIVTPRGILKTGTKSAPVKLLINLLTEKTSKDDKVVILPEGHMVNFLTDRNSDDFYSNLIPMYVEAFGEENIIKHFALEPPQWFVLATRDLTEYGTGDICVSYAQNLCDWIFNNYFVVYKILGEPQYIILRKI